LKFRGYGQFLIFGVIGGINTLIHSGVVITLVEVWRVHAVVANVVAFICANMFSFLMNCRFTFQNRPTWTLYRRFALVSLFSLALTVCLSAIAVWMEWHYLVGLLLVILVGPFLTFILHKNYAFKRDLSPATDGSVVQRGPTH
jgi:putative flippase GtrA